MREFFRKLQHRRRRRRILREARPLPEPRHPEPSDLPVNHLYPVPEHCGQQMRLCGNWSLQELEFQCPQCFIRLRASVQFRYLSTMGEELDPEVREAIDQTA